MKFFFTFLLFGFINTTSFQLLPIYSNINEENKQLVKSSFSKYRLGSGDKLLIRVYKIHTFDATVSVLPDGTINLPRIGEIFVKGLTINELKSKLVDKYKLILKNPIIYVDLTYSRPVRVMVTGEVNRPGIYTIGTSESNQISNLDGGETTSIRSQGWPTVVEAIQKAGGVKIDGNLKEIKLVREEIKMNVDFWTPLKSGQIVENPLLFDGDSIYVPLADKKTYDETFKISSSSFSPSNITVSVIGEVKSPGKITLLANSPISQSIYVAGGYTFRANKKYVDLIRLNRNGSVTKTRHSKIFDNSNPENDNVLLNDGDIVIIDRTFLSQVSDSMKNITQPLAPALDARAIYKILND